MYIYTGRRNRGLWGVHSNPKYKISTTRRIHTITNVPLHNFSLGPPVRITAFPVRIIVSSVHTIACLLSQFL